MQATDDVTIDADAWCDRCAQRIVEIDSDVSTGEALRLAGDVYAFERTRTMAPEDAADFVASEMARDGRLRFERRKKAR